MPSIASTSISATPIGNGRVSVTFNFSIDNGDLISDGPREYPVATDLKSASVAIGQNVLAAKVIQEISQWLTSVQTGTLRYATTAQIVQALRDAYHSFNQWQLCQLSAVLLAYYQAGVFTAAQFQSAFGITAGQWTTLANQVQTYAGIYNSANAAVGQ